MSGIEYPAPLPGEWTFPANASVATLVKAVHTGDLRWRDRFFVGALPVHLINSDPGNVVHKPIYRSVLRYDLFPPNFDTYDATVSLNILAGAQWIQVLYTIAHDLALSVPFLEVADRALRALETKLAQHYGIPDEGHLTDPRIVLTRYRDAYGFGRPYGT